MVLWAANFIVVKDALATLPPVGFTMLRYGLASIALLVILRWREGADPAAAAGHAADPASWVASASGCTRSCGRPACRRSPPAIAR